MSEITNYLGGYLNELNNYMERLNSDRLSRKDRRLFLEMSSEYYDVFKESAGVSENNINEFPAGLLDTIATFNDNIISQEDNSRELANQYYGTIAATANDYIERVERSELQFRIFQNDAEILRLQEEKLQLMQNLVDLEMKRDGQISPETSSILEVQHSRIINGQVQEIEAWEQDDLPGERYEPQGKEEQPDQTQEPQIEYVNGKRVVDKEELDQILNDHIRNDNSRKTLDLSNCIIRNYEFKGDLNSISFDHSELWHCEFRMTKSDHVSMRDTSLNDCKLTKAEFNHCNFESAGFKGTVFQYDMFRGCSFDSAYMKQSPIRDSIFYKTSFDGTHIREGIADESNVFHDCGRPYDTVRLSGGSMTRSELEKYSDEMRRMFNNEGLIYSWELGDVDMKNQEAEIMIKISQDGESLEEQKYSVILDPDTYAISHISSLGRHDDPIARMFIPEMEERIQDVLKNPEINKSVSRVKLQLPYMKRETFLEAKEELKRMGAKFDAKEKAWYVEQSAGKDVIGRINEYLSKHDDAIYLKLPSVDAQKFKQILGEIKQNGARYNPIKKRWYITETMDWSKFFSYLPTKDSVHQKLNQYKEDAKASSTGQVSEYHKKDTPERT